MITITCLILWIEAGAFAGLRRVPAGVGTVRADNPTIAAPDRAMMSSDLRMTLPCWTFAF